MLFSSSSGVKADTSQEAGGTRARAWQGHPGARGFSERPGSVVWDDISPHLMLLSAWHVCAVYHVLGARFPSCCCANVSMYF